MSKISAIQHFSFFLGGLYSLYPYIPPCLFVTPFQFGMVLLSLPEPFFYLEELVWTLDN